MNSARRYIDELEELLDVAMIEQFNVQTEDDSIQEVFYFSLVGRSLSRQGSWYLIGIHVCFCFSCKLRLSDFLNFGWVLNVFVYVAGCGANLYPA